MSDNIISGFMSIRIPDDYPSIQDALNFLSDKIILTGVDILVSDGEYEISSSITSQVRDYGKLTIRGNESDCSKCIIKVDNTNNTDGFLFEGGCGVAWLNGFTIVGQNGFISKGQWNSNTYSAGIRVVNSSVKLGSQIVIDKMYYGIRAMHGANITNKTPARVNGQQGGGIKVLNAGDVAFHAYAASLLVDSAEAYDTAHDIEGLGFGFCAEGGGFISCENAIANGNAEAGFYALTNGSVWAHGISASYNKYGVLAWGGNIECNSLDDYITNCANNQIGIYATYKGFIGANRASCHNNNTGVLCDNNALIDITNLKSENNSFDGFKCDISGVINGFNMSSIGNGGDGYHCANGSQMNLTNPVAENNTGHGYYAKNISSMFINGMKGTGNGSGLRSPDPESNSPTGGNSHSFIFDLY